jgi:WD40 repeat protein
VHVGFSGASDVFATSSSGDIRVWHARTRNELVRIVVFSDFVWVFAFYSAICIFFFNEMIFLHLNSTNIFILGAQFGLSLCNFC